MNFTVDCRADFAVVSFTLLGDVLKPSDLGSLQIPDIPLNQGIVLSGKGPIWLFAYLCHHFHPSRWVATHDPRLGGAVVVQSHFPGVAPGQVIPI